MTPEKARQAIKRACDQKGWSVMDLARKTEVSPEAIRRFVNSSGQVSTRVVFRLLKALDIEKR